MIGARIRQLRMKRGLTVADCARRIGVSQSTFRDWEYGRAIQGEPYVELSEILGVSLSELMTGQVPQGIVPLTQSIDELSRKLLEFRSQLLSIS